MKLLCLLLSFSAFADLTYDVFYQAGPRTVPKIQVMDDLLLIPGHNIHNKTYILNVHTGKKLASFPIPWGVLSSAKLRTGKNRGWFSVCHESGNKLMLINVKKMTYQDIHLPEKAFCFTHKLVKSLLPWRGPEIIISSVTNSTIIKYIPENQKTQVLASGVSGAWSMDLQGDIFTSSNQLYHPLHSGLPFALSLKTGKTLWGNKGGVETYQTKRAYVLGHLSEKNHTFYLEYNPSVLTAYSHKTGLQEFELALGLERSRSLTRLGHCLVILGARNLQNSFGEPQLSLVRQDKHGFWQEVETYYEVPVPLIGSSLIAATNKGHLIVAGWGKVVRLRSKNIQRLCL